MYNVLFAQTCCSADYACCCTKRHQLRHDDVTRPSATLVLGLQLCIAEAELPAAAGAGNQSMWAENDDEGYDLATYEHRRSIEADYHVVNCLANQPQVSLTMTSLKPSVSVTLTAARQVST